MIRQTIKTLGMSVVLIPSLSGMRALEKIDESILPVDARNRGFTQLHVAAYLGHVAEISELLASEACPLSASTHEKDSAGSKVLSNKTRLFFSFANRATVALEMAASTPNRSNPAGDSLVCAKSINGCTALHVAAEQGQLRAVEVLISKNQSLVNMQDAADLTPLAYAAIHGHTDVIKYLIAHGANKYLTGKRATAVYSAAQRGFSVDTPVPVKESLVRERVLKYIQDSVTNKRGYLPFHRAAQNGHLEAMKLFQPDEHICGKDGYALACYLALPCAVESGNLEILDFVMHLLAGRRDRQMEHKIRAFSNGVTPLLLAASSGHVSVMQWYLSQPDAHLRQGDLTGACALHYAARYGHTEAVQFLLEKDAELVKIKTHSGVSPLHEAAEYGHSKVIELLLEYNAEIDPRDKSGSTPLALAAKNGHVEALTLLISRGASLTVTDSTSGRTPLHIAAAAGRKACVEVLIQNKADIEAKDSTKQTPLLCAADHGQLEVIKCLLSHNADIKQQSTYGNALVLALKHGDEIVHYLIENTDVELTSCGSCFSDRVPAFFHAVHIGKSVEGYKAVRFLLKKEPILILS